MRELLDKLKDNNILLEPDNGQLRIFAAGPQISPDLLAEIKSKKEELLQFLLNNQQQGSLQAAGAHIPVLGEQDGYILSSSQQRLWVLSQFQEGNVAYNMSGAYVFTGDLHTDALEYAFHTLVQRHESLRTVFTGGSDGKGLQIILSAGRSAFRLQFHDLRHEEKPGSAARVLAAEEAVRPFDLSKGPLIRASLLQVEDHKWVFVYTLHHIISDQWSMTILIRELLLLYNTRVRQEESPLPLLRIQYKDYAAWQQHQLKSDASGRHKEFWLQQLKGELPVLELATDRPRPAVRTYNGGVTGVMIDKTRTQLLRRICQEEGATLFMGLLASLNALLYRYTGQNDLIIGSPMAAREHTDLQDQIGFYVNILPLRTSFDTADSYRQLLATVKQSTLAAYEHQAYPFDEMLNDLDPVFDASRHPLFDVIIELRARDDKWRLIEGLAGINATPYEDRTHTISKFDLSFFFTESDEELQLSVEYNSDLYDGNTIDRLCAHYLQLVTLMTRRPDDPVRRLDYIDEQERKRLMDEFNHAVAAYTEGRSVIHLFREQAERDPDAIALIYGDGKMSYRQLHERSGRLAAYLKDVLHIRRGDLVGIMLDRSEYMIVALLGVLKAGGAYVPIDPDHPRERRSFIIKDTGVRVLITQMEHAYDVQDPQVTLFAIDIQLETIDEDVAYRETAVEPNDPAYVIYTSGSTGEPKGCTITHRNLFNYIQWANGYYFKETDRPRFGLFTALSFDLTVTAIFCSLTMGGSLHIYPQGDTVEAILLHSFGQESGVDSIKLTPSHINLLEQAGIRSHGILRTIIGGEEVTSRHVGTLKAINPDMEIFNEYGPTEATVGCVVAPLQEDRPVVIGQPIARTRIYVLDGEGLLCPIGIPGELYISGAGVAAGYLNRPDLTHERFIEDRFMPGEKMYRTGDRGRWLPDGNLQFMGRRDQQVKISGYRIELEEIESRLLQHSLVKQTVVLARRDTEGNNMLMAYFVPHSPGDHQQDLREWLRTKLPHYMIPAYFIEVSSIPLTSNGKTDKKALADMGIPRESTVYAAPGNRLEEKLAAIWQETLNLERIGVKSSFFELGGNSIKAMRLLGRLNKELGIDYRIDNLFRNPTIRDMAEEIEKTGVHTMEMDESPDVEKFVI